MQMRRHGKKYLFISHIGNHFEIILKSLAEWFYFVRIFFSFFETGAGAARIFRPFQGKEPTSAGMGRAQFIIDNPGLGLSSKWRDVDRLWRVFLFCHLSWLERLYPICNTT